MKLICVLPQLAQFDGLGLEARLSFKGAGTFNLLGLLGRTNSASKALLAMCFAVLPEKAVCAMPPGAGGAALALSAVQTARFAVKNAHFGEFLLAATMRAI